MPSFEQVDELPRSLTMIVPPEYLDINNHMNVRHYLAVHDDAFNPFFEEIGFGLRYISDTNLSFFQVENHISYLAEVSEGDEISVHVRLLGRTSKAVHGISYILNRETRRVANSLEFVALHVDLGTRRPVDFGSPAIEQVDRRMAADSQTDWLAPTSGCIRLRR